MHNVYRLLGGASLMGAAVFSTTDASATAGAQWWGTPQPDSIIAIGGNFLPEGEWVTMTLWATPDSDSTGATWYGIDTRYQQSQYYIWPGFVEYLNTTQGCTSYYFSGNIKHIYVQFTDGNGNNVSTPMSSLSGC